jgi:AcrR family transcriptional regulator
MIRQSSRTATAPKRRVAGRKRLDRQQVLQAARELRGGLSIRALAEQLEIRPPSIYSHFDGLADIQRELALWGFQVLTAQLGQAAVGLSGADALIAVGKAYLAFIRAEPGLYAATVPTPSEDDTELRAAADAWLAIFYKVLRGLHMDEESQVHALRGIRSIVHGFGMLEASGAFRTKYARDSSFEIVLRNFVDGVTGGR